MPRSTEGLYALAVDITHGLVLCEGVQKVAVIRDLASVRILDYGQSSRHARHSYRVPVDSSGGQKPRQAAVHLGAVATSDVK